MHISSISSPTTTSVQAAPAVKTPDTKPVQAAPAVKPSEPVKVSVSTAPQLSSTVQEARETPQQTRSEAARGDRQAIRLLAKETAASQLRSGEQGVNIKA